MTSPVDVVRIEPLVLKVKALPLSLNVWSREWKKRHAQTTEWKLRVWNEFGSERRQKVHLYGPWFPGRVKVTIIVHVAGWKKIDLDNLAPKAILDGLKGLAFTDDNLDVLRPIVLDGERIPSGHPSWTEIIVEDMR